MPIDKLFQKDIRFNGDLDFIKLIEFRFLNKISDKSISLYLDDLSDPKLAQHITKLNNPSSGYEVYFSPAFRQKNVINGHVKSSTKEDVTQTRCLWVDVDQPTYDHSSYLLPPNLVVNSGRGLQLYWVLDSYIKPDENLLKRLQVCYNGDPACSNIASFMRFPGTLNHKYTPPKPAYLSHELDVLYSLSEIKVALDFGLNWHTWIKSANKVVPIGQRSEHEFTLISQLNNFKFSEQVIKTIIDYHFNESSKVKENNHNLQMTLDKVINNNVHHIPDIEPITISLNGDDKSLDKPSQSSSSIEIPNNYKPSDVFEGRGVYFSLDKNDQPIVLSNYVYHLTAIQGGLGGGFIVDIEAGKSIWRNQIVSNKSFTNATTYCGSLPYAQMSWFGNDLQTKKLKHYLSSKWEYEGLPTKYITSKLGLDIDSTPNLYITSDQVYNLDWQPDLDTIYVPPAHEHPVIKKYSYSSVDKQQISNIIDNIINLNNKTVMQTMLGWFVACHIKPKLNKLGIRFPHLLVCGSPGAGKTTTITKVFQPIMQYPNTQLWQANSTPFVLLTLLGSTNSIPVCLTEFRDSTQRNHAKFLQLLRSAYDGGKDSRGKPDQTSVTYDLSSPVCIDGEEIPTDAALLERIVPVYLDKKQANKPALISLLKYNLHALGSYILEYFINISELDILTMYEAEQAKIDDNSPQRIKDNYAVINTSLRLLSKMLDKEDTDNNLIGLSSLSILSNNQITPDESVINDSSKTAIMIFLEDIVLYVLSSDVKGDVLFRTKDKGELGIHLVSCYNWWKQKSRSAGVDVPPLATIKRQFKELEGTILINARANLTNQNRVVHLHNINLLEASKVLDIDIYT